MQLNWFHQLFGVNKPVIGMLHLPPLPGSPRSSLSLSEILDFILQEAEKLKAAGFHGLLLENFGDVPFYKERVPAHTIACMAVVAHRVRQELALPLGVNVLRNDSVAALAVALASSANFIRVNVLHGARLTDQGLIEGKAAKTLRYRTLLKAKVRIFADVSVKHSWPLTPVCLEEELHDLVERSLADAVILSGRATGAAPQLKEVERSHRACGKSVPLLIGSGVTADNLVEFFPRADGFIVGTSIKENAMTSNPIDTDRAVRLINQWRALSQRASE